jgi:hypothetical protein
VLAPIQLALKFVFQSWMLMTLNVDGGVICMSGWKFKFLLLMFKMTLDCPGECSRSCFWIEMSESP